MNGGKWNLSATLFLVGVTIALFFMPSPRLMGKPVGSPERARVLSVDNTLVNRTGLLNYGTQRLEVEVLSGACKGRKFSASNELRAQMDLDKEFVTGDTALVIVTPADEASGGELVARDHWRLTWIAVLFLSFCVTLVAFGGWIGAKSLFSFVFSCVVIWKGLVPLALAGWSASWVAYITVMLLTAAIMYLVAGLTRKAFTAFLGSCLGIAAGLAVAHVVGLCLHVNGATMPFVQALFYSGYDNLNLPDIFIAAALLACSGAVMDLAMDVAAGVEEVVRHSPDLTSRQLFMSGLRIGRSVVGTMTTTLLLAYSGGYITLLMVFAAQGTSPLDFLNSAIVSAEIAKTLSGSFALVLVAPFTAFVASVMMRKRK